MLHDFIKQFTELVTANQRENDEKRTGIITTFLNILKFHIVM